MLPQPAAQPQPQRPASSSPASKRENIPDPFSTQEIDDAILGGIALFEKEWSDIESAFGAQTMRQTLGLIWSKMSPEQKAHFQQSNPDLYKQAIGLFGK